MLTPIVADELIRFSGQSLVAPQSMLEESCWDEMQARLTERGDDVLHVVLESEEHVLRGRIGADRVEVGARQWRLDHVAECTRARPWLLDRADLVLDTTHLTPSQVADRVWAAATPRLTRTIAPLPFEHDPGGSR